MKCISIIQPWASLIILGAKQYETRSWNTNYRGPLLIHASANMPRAALELLEINPFRDILNDLAYPWEQGHQLPRGVILGVVNLDDCLDAEAVDITAQERAFGNFGPGRYAWRLSLAAPLVSPIPYKGKLGLYDVPDEIVQAELMNTLAGGVLHA